MSFLSSLLALESGGLAGKIWTTVALLDEAAQFLQSRIGDARRIGPHVCNQAGCSFVTDLDSLIEPLSDHHGAFDGKVQLTPGFLLQLARGEWRNGTLFLFLFIDRRDNKRYILQMALNFLSQLLV